MFKFYKNLTNNLSTIIFQYKKKKKFHLAVDLRCRELLSLPQDRWPCLLYTSDAADE